MRPGKAPVSCIPCAKRKVRCDKQLPCCHCKRRPQDTCQYPTPISAPEKSAHDLDERVRELERYVRRFDGDPKAANGEASGYPTPNSATHLPARTREPESRSFQALVVEADAPGSTSGLVADDAGTAYIETPMWYSFGEIEQPEDVSPYSHPKGMALPPSSARTSYRPSIIDPANDPSRSYVDAPQLPTTHIDFLWKTFLKNVHPLTKIFFDWEVEPIVLKARDAEASLSKVDRALIFSIVLKSVNSLTEDECTLQLHDDQARLFDRFQRATEDALRNVSYALTTNKTTLQAFMLYLLAISESAQPTAIHSLLGIANRIAERMGLHRDGTVLGLSPLRAEERRRMWWQLQYMDLSVSRYVGALSTTIFANWDAHAPGNIEDADIGPDTKTMPPERTGLTEISPCLWCYHVLKINRSLKQPHSGGKSMAWALSPSVPLAEKDAMIDKIESDLRARYLQYCEPLNPLHVHVQLGIYQYLLAGRRVMRQPALVNAKISEMSRSKRDDFLAVCTKSLEYGNMAQTTETLNGFLWHNRGFFPWVALVYVILESYHRFDEDNATGLWTLIRSTYSAFPELSIATHRQDITFAARITVASWKKHAAHIKTQPATGMDQVPSWILKLCDNFELSRPSVSSEDASGQACPDASGFLGADFNFDFDMMDWSSWDDSFVMTQQ